MRTAWIQFTCRIDQYIRQQKAQLMSAGVFASVFLALLIVLAELLLFIVSIPLYFTHSTKRICRIHSEIEPESAQNYTVRRTVSLLAIFASALGYLLKLGAVGVVGLATNFFLTFGATSQLSVNFTDSTNYTYNDLAIEFTETEAQLKTVSNSLTSNSTDFSSGTFSNTEEATEGLQLNTIDNHVSADDAPLLYLSFDNESDLLADGSGNAHTSTVYGDPSYTSVGAIGGAIDFDGNDYVTIDSDLGDPTEMTVELWFKSADLNQPTDYLVDARAGGNWWLLLDYTSTTVCTDTEGNLCFFNRVEIPSTELTNDTWHHVAVTATATETTAYLDGTLIATGSGLDPDLGAGLTLGARYNVRNYLTAQMDELVIWDSVLDASTIAEHALDGHVETGTYTSSVLDATRPVNWSTLSWDGIIPEGTTLQAQVRFCDDSACDGEDFVGPGNDAEQYFTGGSDEDVSGATGRYFQYQLTFAASDDQQYTPSISSLTAGYSYYTNVVPSVEQTEDVTSELVDTWVGFTETATKEGSAELSYQLSTDVGTTWQYWDGAQWTNVSDDTQRNTATEINRVIDQLDATSQTLRFKAFFVSNGTDQITLSGISVDYREIETSDSEETEETTDEESSSETEETTYTSADDETSSESEEESTGNETTQPASSGSSTSSSRVGGSRRNNTDETDTDEDAVTAPTGTGISPVTGEVEAISDVEPGDIVRGTSFNSVYYVDSNYERHPYPNDVIYFTWNDSWDDVLEVTDATLSAMTLAEPVLPKPGVVLVKKASDPRVYLVEENPDDPFAPTLRWLISENVCTTLYGDHWAEYVVDIDPALLRHFEDGEEVTMQNLSFVIASDMKKREELTVVSTDSDGDTLSDVFERTYGLNPHSVDSDSDGYSDWVEIINGYNPNGDGRPDSDGDGLYDWTEYYLGTDPKNVDSDGDGYPDGVEVENGYDPLS